MFWLKWPSRGVHIVEVQESALTVMLFFLPLTVIFCYVGCTWLLVCNVWYTVLEPQHTTSHITEKQPCATHVTKNNKRKVSSRVLNYYSLRSWRWPFRPKQVVKYCLIKEQWTMALRWYRNPKSDPLVEPVGLCSIILLFHFYNLAQIPLSYCLLYQNLSIKMYNILRDLLLCVDEGFTLQKEYASLWLWRR
jgi:hypothetical protein